jgi:MFS family permease
MQTTKVEPTTPAAPPARKSVLRALRHRNYRLYFIGQGISLIGTWMQQVALTWLIYLKTDDPFWLGMIGFAGQLPTFFLSPVAGVLSDHWNRLRVLLGTQTLSMLQAFALAFLALTDRTEVWHAVALATFLGGVNAFDIVTRQAFLTDLLEDKRDLGNAIALNSSIFNGARLVGPSVAGVLLAYFSPGVCFLLNGFSYLAVLLALLAMRLPAHAHLAAHASARPPLFAGLLQGFRYVFGSPPIRSILGLLALVSLVGAPYTVLMPVFANDPDIVAGVPHVLQLLVPGQGRAALTLGLLVAAVGVGALSGAIYLAARQSVLGLGRWIALAPAAFGLGLIAFSYSHTLGLSLLLLVATGFAMMVQMASSNTVLQTIVEDDKRGRVMSFYTMAFMGMMPLGSFLAGVLAKAVGAAATLRLGGAACILGGLIFAVRLGALRQAIRPIYRQLGILPELPSEPDVVRQAFQPDGQASQAGKPDVRKRKEHHD